jgi:hypothetical protein
VKGKATTRTGTGSGMGLGSRSPAIEGVVLHLEAALGFRGVAAPQGAQARVPGRGPLERAEESALRKHCAVLRPFEWRMRAMMGWVWSA